MKEECSQCGVCCRLFLINLTEEEYKSGKYKTLFEEFGVVEDFKEAEMTAANIISQNEDGSCIYLKENRCSIHSFRPMSCRYFFCNSNNPKFSNMITKINSEKQRIKLS